MPEVVEIPLELTRFQLSPAVQFRLQFLLDRQDKGYTLSEAERQEAEGLVELVEFLSLLQSKLTLASFVGVLKDSPIFQGDSVMIQRQMRDEWD
ncbi:MAG: hypothetical protein HC916_03390 [Coleofasciculaceae cyanobacterium SM2_1_6]|nr:hypothetical protein [Coleofasciculaceae cyanobacterium SM2_1_6]